MTDFEQQVVAGLAEVRTEVRAVGDRVSHLTERFEVSETVRVQAQTLHAERFARIEARLGTNGSTRPAFHVVASADRDEAEEYRSLRRVVGRVARSWVLWVVLGLIGSGGAVGAGLRCAAPAAVVTAGTGGGS